MTRRGLPTRREVTVRKKGSRTSGHTGVLGIRASGCLPLDGTRTRFQKRGSFEPRRHETPHARRRRTKNKTATHMNRSHTKLNCFCIRQRYSDTLLGPRTASLRNHNTPFVPDTFLRLYSVSHVQFRYPRSAVTWFPVLPVFELRLLRRLERSHTDTDRTTKLSRTSAPGTRNKKRNRTSRNSKLEHIPTFET